MEPVTHFLTGACIGRAGFNRKTAYATMAAVFAAEAADLDILWGLAGPVEGLKHHRGITHTFIAVPVAAAAIVGAVWLVHAWRARHRRAADTATRPRSRQPVHWGWLYLTAFIAASSHLLLDWTNNYGLRPFFPFNPRWYAGSFVFIAEPVMWALLILALVAPALTGLIGGEIGARRQPFRGRGWAILALSGIVILWCWRWVEHAQALALAGNMQIATEPVKRMGMEPYPVNPFRWHAIVETDNTFQTAEVDTRKGLIDTDPQTDVLYKPQPTPAVEAAKLTPLGRVYLDWGSWAVVRDIGRQPVPCMAPPQLPPNRLWTTVEFSDLRFQYSYLGSGRPTGRSPLAAWVYIVDGRDDGGEAMNGREQK